MAAKYKRAGIGNWSADASWSTTSGGAADTTAPTAADDVFLDANSGICTIDTTASCRSINCTGFTADLEHTSGITLSIGDGTAGASNIALKFVSGMNYTSGSSAVIQFISTSATVQTVDFAGKTTRSVTFNATSNGSWQYTGAHNTNASDTVTLTKGTLDVNGQTCSWGFFSSSNSNTRTLTLGAAAITLTGTGGSNAWTFSTFTNLTFNCGTSTITFTGTAPTLNLGAQTYYNIVVNGSTSWGDSQFAASTCTNFTYTGTAVKTSTLTMSNGFGSFTCTGTFTVNGNSATNRVLVQSNTVGTARTITAATVVVTNADFQDITGAGAGSWDLSAITGGSGDCGGNSGITFTTSAEQTCTMSTNQNWSTAGIWTSRVPLPQDDVVMTGVTGGTLTADMPRLGRSISWTGATGNPTWSFASTANSIFGSITLISGMTISGTQILTLAGRGNYNITCAGKTLFNGQVIILAPSGTYTFNDNFSTSGILVWQIGNLVDNGYTVEILRLSTSNTTAKSLTSTNGNWILTVNSVASVWNIPSTSNVTITGNPNITISSTSTSARTFNSDINLTYGTLTYTVAGSTGKLTITGSNSFAAINFSDASNARTLEFTAGTTTTIRNANGFNVQGTSGKLMTVTSATAATHTLSSTGQQSCDYLNLSYSVAQGGGAWYAGANSTNSGNNTGWRYTPPLTASKAYSPQEILNFYYGSGSQQYTEQEIANMYNSTAQHSLTFQEVLNVRAGREPHAMTEQEALFANLKTALSLTGNDKQYSVQELLIMAALNGVSLSTVLG